MTGKTIVDFMSAVWSFRKRRRARIEEALKQEEDRLAAERMARIKECEEETIRLEQAITDAGRENVFDLAAANGWPRGSGPPKWVWWQIVRLVESQQAAERQEMKDITPRQAQLTNSTVH